MLHPSWLQSGENLLRGAYPPHARKDAFDGVDVAFRTGASHGIVGEDEIVATLIGIAGCAFNAELGGNTTEDYGVQSPGDVVASLGRCRRTHPTGA